jgi:hypothetical protein
LPEWIWGSSIVTSRASSRGELLQGVGEAVDVAQRAGEVEGGVELGGDRVTSGSASRTWRKAAPSSQAARASRWTIR